MRVLRYGEATQEQWSEHRAMLIESGNRLASAWHFLIHRTERQGSMFILDKHGKPQYADPATWMKWRETVTLDDLTIGYNKVVRNMDGLVFSVSGSAKCRNSEVIATVETKFVANPSYGALVWETVWVGGNEVWRTESRSEAEASHRMMVAMIEKIYRDEKP